jgi:iron complex outermembrane receptor protein
MGLCFSVGSVWVMLPSRRVTAPGATRTPCTVTPPHRFVARALTPGCALLYVVALAASGAGSVRAQAPDPPDESPAATIDPVVVTATRSVERAFDLPVAIDTVGKDQIQLDQLQINLSESLARIPGIFIQSRWNYAQDLALSVRGFGARANFGVRGVRLYQDNIPATMPDGQGQTGSFSLVSAQRIEVLRGPFSSLYGNASGGVISVFTEDGPAVPVANAQLIGGSYGTWNAIGKLGGQSGAVNYVVAGNRFETDGYRDHSNATRDLGNAKVRLAAGPDTAITLIANSFYQPEAQDPLGLTRAEWEANPQQADPAAARFNTRKTVSQFQGGTTIEQRLSDDADLRVTAYGGTRQVRQYLAFPGTAITSSGGVTDLDRTFGGVDARVNSRFALAGQPFTLTLGANYESEREHRQGFVNDSGNLGEQRRNEDNTLSNTDGYLQLEWTPPMPFSLFAGVRYSDVQFDSVDHFIVGANGDDSGSSAYSHASPVAGLVWHVRDDLNVYANYGQGFETPTFTELAYRNAGSGLNLGLQPSLSKSAEVGLKAFLGPRQRLNLALFNVETSNEIVIDTATGGRTTYKNAASTRRRGAEAAWDGELGAGFGGYASATWLQATFTSAATTGQPPEVVPAGARLPGVPMAQAYGELTWSYPAAAGLRAGLEVQYAGRMYVNDRNTDFAPAYTIGNLRIGFEQHSGAWALREFARLNNFTDKNYVGTVIVGDTNGRYFEPAATRNFLIGVSVSATL